MILQDRTPIWATTYRSIFVDGEAEDYYTDLREESINVQMMSDEIELKTYGEITNSVIVLRADNPPAIAKGNHIYLTKPEATGTVEIDGVAYDTYPKGEYAAESVKPSYIGGNHIQNPTVITARAVT